MRQRGRSPTCWPRWGWSCRREPTTCGSNSRCGAPSARRAAGLTTPNPGSCRCPWTTPMPASIDFETYSGPGYVWADTARRWGCLPNASAARKGLSVVGAARYAEHPSTEVLTLSYDLGDGHGVQRWRPGHMPPVALFRHVREGGLLHGWNTAFEHWIWNKVCVRRYGWPPLPQRQLRCTMARSRAHALPGGLAAALEVLGTPDQKDKDGKRLLDKFSKPRNPTKADPRPRVRPEDDPEDAERLYAYCDRDVIGEAGAGARLPELAGLELEFWLADQAINTRGVALDTAAVADCTAIVAQAHGRYNAELLALTGIDAASKVQQLTGWLHARGVHLDSLDEDAVAAALGGDLSPEARRVLEIRQAVGAAAVKKLYAMANQVAEDGRLHDLFSFHGARTGRATGNGPQPTNLPNSGPQVYACAGCGKHSGRLPLCAWCGAVLPPAAIGWNHGAAADVLELARAQSLDLIEYVFPAARPAVAGCLRGLFVAAPGHDLVCSDYSSIEAVVLAEVAGCEWRREVFRTHGRIYEVSAAAITGIPFDPATVHVHRKLGKVAELACFSPDTRVLTDCRYLAIMDVSKEHLLWDWIEWVS